MAQVKLLITAQIGRVDNEKSVNLQICKGLLSKQDDSQPHRHDTNLILFVRC